MGLFTKKTKPEIRSEQHVEDESTAASLIFGQFRLDDASTTLSAFFSAMELISNSVAQLPILVKRDLDVDYNHPINLLFKHTLMSKFMFIKQMICDVILHGNAYAYIERANDGTPINLVYCENGTVNVFYQQNTQELYYQIPFLRKGKIEPIDVIHIYKNSNNGITGRSLISYASKILNLAKATDKAASKYYSSGCALQGALTIKGTRKGAKEAARQAFATTHSGDTGSGLVILDDDMTYTPLSGNANDSQMLEARMFNVQEVARYFNINPILLGDNKGISYNTIEAANIEFVTHTLMPYIALFEDEFNRKLVKPSEENIKIDFDETYLIKGDKNTTATYLKTLTGAGIISINEARKQLGLTPVDGGNECIIPFTAISDNKINSKTDGE